MWRSKKNLFVLFKNAVKNFKKNTMKNWALLCKKSLSLSQPGENSSKFN